MKRLAANLAPLPRRNSSGPRPVGISHTTVLSGTEEAMSAPERYNFYVNSSCVGNSSPGSHHCVVVDHWPRHGGGLMSSASTVVPANNKTAKEILSNLSMILPSFSGSKISMRSLRPPRKKQLPTRLPKPLLYIWTILASFGAEQGHQ